MGHLFHGKLLVITRGYLQISQVADFPISENAAFRPSGLRRRAEPVLEAAAELALWVGFWDV